MVSSTVGGYSMLTTGTGSPVSLHQSWSKLKIPNCFGLGFLLGVLGVVGRKYWVILVLGGVPGCSFSERALDEDFCFGEGSLSSSSAEYALYCLDGGGMHPCSLKYSERICSLYCGTGMFADILNSVFWSSHWASPKLVGYLSILFLLRGRGGGVDVGSCVRGEKGCTSASESEGSRMEVDSVRVYNEDTWLCCGVELVLADDSVDAIVLKIQ